MKRGAVAGGEWEADLLAMAASSAVAPSESLICVGQIVQQARISNVRVFATGHED